MADLGNRGAVDALINSILYDLAPNDSIQPSDHNGMLADILDTLANGLYTTLRTNNETGGIDIIITDGDGVQFGSGAFAGRIVPATLTGNNIYTLPDATGTIALLDDIENIYNADGILTGNRTVDMNGNELTLDNGVLNLANTGDSSLMVFDPNSDVSTLNPGTTITAGQITNRQLGHLVVDIIANDNDDSFAIRSNKNNLGPNPVDTILKVVSTDGYETNFLNTTVIADARLKNNHFSFYNNSGKLGVKYKNNAGTITPLSIGENISNADLTFNANQYADLSTFSWTLGGTAPIGTEKISLQKDTLIKGSDTSSSTSGFKFVDSTNASLLDVRNNGKFFLDTSKIYDAEPFKIETYPFGGTGTKPYLKINGYGEVEILSRSSNIFTVKNSVGSNMFQVQNGNIVINSQINATSSFVHFEMNTGGLLLYNNTKTTLHHKIMVTEGGLRNVYFGMQGFNGGGFVVGGTAKIGSENISLQEDTLVGKTGSKVGFMGTAPIVKITTGVSAGAFVANTSGITDDTATFGGYTIGQIAQALINYGLLT